MNRSQTTTTQEVTMPASTASPLAVDEAGVARYFAVLEGAKLGDRFRHGGVEVTVVETQDKDGSRAVCATSDGGKVGKGWHEGAETGEPVYYVLMTSTSCHHGWLDSKSRNITQTG